MPEPIMQDVPVIERDKDDDDHILTEAEVRKVVAKHILEQGLKEYEHALYASAHPLPEQDEAVVEEVTAASDRQVARAAAAQARYAGRRNPASKKARARARRSRSQ